MIRIIDLVAEEGKVLFRQQEGQEPVIRKHVDNANEGEWSEITQTEADNIMAAWIAEHEPILPEES